MCGTRPPAQTSKILLRALLLSAAMSLVLAAPALAAVDCVGGSKATPADLIPACSTIIDQTTNPACGVQSIRFSLFPGERYPRNADARSSSCVQAAGISSLPGPHTGSITTSPMAHGMVSRYRQRSMAG